jgi:hypothetical protein
MFVSSSISWKTLNNAFRIKFGTQDDFIMYYKDHEKDQVAIIDDSDKEQAFTEYLNLECACLEMKLIPARSLAF